MARARNIKPGFYTNDILAECEPLARILFSGLWCFADREGRLEDRPKKIKAEILPYDDCNADDLLNQLEKHGFILRYASGEYKYIQVLNFGKHQNPHVKEQESDIPAPCKTGASMVQEQYKPDEIPEVAGLNPSSLNPSSLIVGSLIHKPCPDSPDAFEEVWAKYPKRPGMSKADSLKAWKRRIKDGVDPQTILSGVLRYADFCKATVTDPQYIKQPATFLGPGEHYLSDWTAPVSRASPVQSIHEKRANTIAYLTGAIKDEQERDITSESSRIYENS